MTELTPAVIIEKIKPWSEDEVTKLKELWAGGKHSAKDIGNELGYSRNSVIGKARRLGLESKKPVKSKDVKVHYQVERQVEKHKVLRRNPAFANYMEIIEVEREIKPEVPVFDIAPEPVYLMDLNSTKCRFPIGEPKDPDFRFCGMPPWEKRKTSYCENHHKLCYHEPDSKIIRIMKWAEKQ